ncbi:cellulose binding domain-containing protein [Micromonospora arida]|uniref:glucuronyl esterase domain-containing protein n=1 Tax=Micromonospora arida TaxID=2203715 RepID=UPI003CF62DA4
MEQPDGRILKADAMGVTGCSRYGKGAFAIGVFDQRIALTMPIESGSAGVPIFAGSAQVNGWTVTMTLPSGASITSIWSANRSGSTGTVQFTNVAYNGAIAAGQSTEFGYQGSGTGAGMTPTCSAG